MFILYKSLNIDSSSPRSENLHFPIIVFQMTNRSELAKWFGSKPAGCIQFVPAHAPRYIIDITQILHAT